MRAWSIAFFFVTACAVETVGSSVDVAGAGQNLCASPMTVDQSIAIGTCHFFTPGPEGYDSYCANGDGYLAQLKFVSAVSAGTGSVAVVNKSNVCMYGLLEGRLICKRVPYDDGNAANESPRTLSDIDGWFELPPEWQSGAQVFQCPVDAPYPQWVEADFTLYTVAGYTPD